MNIFLCGFMGCGKTTIGKLISEKFKYKFIDLDEFISDETGLSVAEIFDKYSEEYFRNSETDALKKLSLTDNTVISLGGGAILNPVNADIIKNSGTVIFIDIDEKVAFKRLKNDTSRPLLNTPDKFDKIKELLKERRPIYRKYSDITVNGDEKPEIIAEYIKKVLKI